MAKTNKTETTEEPTPAPSEETIAPEVETEEKQLAEEKVEKPVEAVKGEEKAKAVAVKVISVIPKVILPELTAKTLPFYRELMIYAKEESLEKLEKDIYNALIVYYKIKLAKRVVAESVHKSIPS